jgi:DNA-binding NarL/FixJ family response regulator
VLRLLALGRNTKEVAYELSLSVKTVESHRAQIMERLAIRDLASLVVYAIRNGIIQLE